MNEQIECIYCLEPEEPGCVMSPDGEHHTDPIGWP